MTSNHNSSGASLPPGLQKIWTRWTRQDLDRHSRAWSQRRSGLFFKGCRTTDQYFLSEPDCFFFFWWHPNNLQIHTSCAKFNSNYMTFEEPFDLFVLYLRVCWAVCWLWAWKLVERCPETAKTRVWGHGGAAVFCRLQTQRLPASHKSWWRPVRVSQD